MEVEVLERTAYRYCPQPTLCPVASLKNKVKKTPAFGSLVRSEQARACSKQTNQITSRRSRRAWSALCVTTASRRWRLAFVVFLRIKWRIRARLRFTLPVPVTLKRFLALEWVFIFGMTKMISVKKWSAKVTPLSGIENKSPKLFG